MIRQSIMMITVFVIIITLGCAAGGLKPGTGGTSSEKKIEKTGHPPVPEGVTCYVCHKREVPENEFHKNFDINCDECHVKSTWMAAEYPHEKWPLDKNHFTRCTFCHKNLSNFDFSYQCWGCHHIEKDTKKFHTDKGIDDISDCVMCHKDTAVKK